MFRKILKYTGITIACLIVLIPSSALLYRKYLEHKVAKRRTISSNEGIDSLDAVSIGGIKQWIQVRGENVSNPILLFIHGGPGIAFIPLSASFQDPWEKHFTVVEWDQRGAGLPWQDCGIGWGSLHQSNFLCYNEARGHGQMLRVVGLA